MSGGLGGMQVIARSAARTGDGLGVKSAIAGIAVLGFAECVQDPIFHRGVGPVVGQAADNTVARSAVCTVDVGIPLYYPRRNNHYRLSQMILALVYPIVLGLDRIETSSFLRANGTFQYLTGLPSFPDPQTLRRFLLHAPAGFWEQLHRVNDRLLQHFIHQLSTARGSFSTSIARWSLCLAIKTAPRSATTLAIAASDPTIRCSVWKPIPP